MQDTNRDRVKSAIGVAAFHALLGYALIVGLGFDIAEVPGETLKLFDVSPEPPPPPPLAEPARPEEKKQRARAENPEGAASPKNLRDTPTPVVALPPIVKLDVPSPTVVAPVAGQGARASAGASDVPGPGTGSGGQGTGLGSGDSGNGTGGGGGGGGVARGPRQIRGSIYDSDYPGSDEEAREDEIVHLRFVVAPHGRVRNCVVTRSSGNRAVDALTCELIERRFRYVPARNEDGDAMPFTIAGTHIWEARPELPPVDVEPDIID